MDIIKIRNRHEQGGIIHMRNEYCSLCLKKLEHVGSVKLKNVKYKSNYSGCQDASFDVFHCGTPGCKPYINMFSWELDGLFKDNDITEFKKEDYLPYLTSYFGDHIEGVKYNEEKGNLSIYGLSFKYCEIIPKNTQPFILKSPIITRVTLNLKTGDTYYYVSEKRQGKIQRINYNESYLSIVNKDVVLAFANFAFATNHLPLSIGIKESNPKFGEGDYLLKCGEQSVAISRHYIINAVCHIVAHPNIYIKYDAYTRKASFRDIDAIHHNLANDNNDMSALCYFTPVSLRFKRAQSTTLLDESRYINSVVKACKIPDSKKFMKNYRQNPYLMGYVDFIQSCGIKEYSNIFKMIDFLKTMSYWPRSGRCYTNDRRFIKDLIKSCGETNAVNKIIAYSNLPDSDGFVYYDSARMYTKLKKAGMDISLLGNLLDIHENCSEASKHLDTINVPIEPTKKEISREFVDSTTGFAISLAEDTHRLVDIGNAMRICVGSYKDFALAKKTTIYYMHPQDQKNDYKGCIEVVGNKLMQAKSYANGLMSGNIAQTLKDWVTEMRLSTRKCRDFKALFPVS